MKLKYTEEWYEREKERFCHSLDLFRPNLDDTTISFLISAYHAPDWDWRTSDGCTGVSEAYWPTLYFPPCIAHDYQCYRAYQATDRKTADRIRKQGDVLFRKANKAYGMSLPRRWLRYWGVRKYWTAVGRWGIPA